MTCPREEAFEEEQPVFFVYEGEGASGFLEFTHGFAPADHVLAELSRESRVWMTTWHFNGGHTILYAADGRTSWTTGTEVELHRHDLVGLDRTAGRPGKGDR
ncbi:hypothetical protein [Nonomuraea aridisoli]|uniref:hypothetical protein n=1 Tax=Nonomuraea aridisoli TaxID=2070368 RepID=UPI0015E89991|nr:hypothetical protein [Nonomuraea aridisoli]